MLKAINKYIINAGVRVDMSREEKAESRLINYMYLYGLIYTLTLIVVNFLFSSFVSILYFYSFATLIIATALYFNHIEKYFFSKQFTLYAFLFYFCIGATIFGEKIALHQCIIAFSFLGMILLYGKKLIIHLSTSIAAFAWVIFYIYPQNYVVLDAAWFNQYLNTIFAFLLIISSLFVYKNELIFFVRDLRRKTKALELANSKLKSANEEILRQREEINEINKTLEQTIEEKINELQEKNSQLLEYAYLNSHKVRKPVANLIGLASILHSKLSEEEITLYIESVKISSLELDEIVKELNKKLSADIGKKQLQDKLN